MRGCPAFRKRVNALSADDKNRRRPVTSGAPWPSAPKTALSARRLQKKQGQIIVCKRNERGLCAVPYIDESSTHMPHRDDGLDHRAAGLLIADLQPYPYPHTNVSVGA